MYLELSVPPFTANAMVWFAGNEIIVPPKGTLAAVALPALTVVAEIPKTQPLAVETDGVVWPAARAPPKRYHTSTVPEVPAAALKTFDKPVKKIG